MSFCITDIREELDKDIIKYSSLFGAIAKETGNLIDAYGGGTFSQEDYDNMERLYNSVGTILNELHFLKNETGRWIEHRLDKRGDL